MRAAVVVEERLAEVEAVLQDGPGDALHARVDGLHAVDRAARAAGDVAVGDALVGEFVQQRGEDVLRLPSSSLERIASSDVCRMCSALRRV